MRVTFKAFDELLPLSKLKKSKHQRNKHPQDQIIRLAKLMDKQGVRHPIHISKRSGEVCFGHGRWAAAKLNKYTEYPIVYQDFESDDEEYACVQSDNAIAMWAELDLSAINLDLANLGPDFDIDLLGIKDFVLEPADKMPGCDEDEVPEQVEATAKLGDIWQLGEHRLMCGDSTSIDAVGLLMAGEKADMVFTSPPYNAGKKGFEANGKYARDKDDDEDEWLQLLSKFTLEWLKVSRMLFVNLQILAGNKIKIHEWLYAFREHFVDQMALIKSTLPCLEANILNSEMESLFIFSPDYRPKKHIKLGIDFRGTVSNVYEMKRSKGEFAKEHRAGFDVSFPEYFISTFLGDGLSVADPFGGTGTTLIACEKTNRKCFMMEIDPHYCDVIVARWEKYTNKKAVLLNGQAETTIRRSANRKTSSDSLPNS